jgi:hypothetical protein
MNDPKKPPRSDSSSTDVAPESRRTYEAPRLLKKRSVARVTLLSGGGTLSAGAITSTN